MKTYKSQTANKGKTIILDSVQQAIDLGYVGIERCHKESTSPNTSYWTEVKNDYNDCVKAISKGDNEFKKQVDEEIDELLDLIDALTPSFSTNKSGFELSQEGFSVSPELAFAGEENCMFRPKVDEEKELKKGSGDGAYRLIINTDVSWWGTPTDNCSLVGALIILMQRFATVEVWIQQGWVGGHANDGVTLFKIDFSAGFDITQLAFWITNPGKDNPFSQYVNKGLGRNNTATSCVAEIEADIMFRGDWQRMYGFSRSYIATKLYTERLDILSKWIAATAYKILYNTNIPTINLDDGSEII